MAIISLQIIQTLQCALLKCFSGDSLGIRHLVVGEYLTFYRIGDDAIEIVRVLHGRRKIEAEDLAP
ncbi:type II toxin-antitoxin system RelE/ParE family toxin [Mesorhizobium sp. GbtcB19]|uniref:type II toxin-antitoxin system RelE/ParE family toxin n=1 Tax=Mesorhizobium sp. GbtcB19 TaxID=2824764 RepID=UPI0027D2D068|nr:type II toxin-antitoxin system RelE/ParE family toxin [Mesorhizobium sp. GbtcB19]